MRCVGLEGGGRAQFEFGFGWERENVVGEGVDFGVEIFGDSMIDDLEEAPFCAGSSKGGQR